MTFHVIVGAVLIFLDEMEESYMCKFAATVYLWRTWTITLLDAREKGFRQKMGDDYIDNIENDGSSLRGWVIVSAWTGHIGKCKGKAIPSPVIPGARGVN